MVEKHRIGRAVIPPPKSITAAIIVAPPHLGWKPPPVLIGHETIPLAVLVLRAKNYKHAYSKVSGCNLPDWNNYVTFGIQDFDSLLTYQTHIAKETQHEGYLRVARYYRNHLTTQTPVDRDLLKTMPKIETALALSHPGFFDMSLTDIDAYLHALTPAGMDLEQTDDSLSSLATAAKPPPVYTAGTKTPSQLPTSSPDSIPEKQSDLLVSTPTGVNLALTEKDAATTMPPELAPLSTPSQLSDAPHDAVDANLMLSDEAKRLAKKAKSKVRKAAAKAKQKAAHLERASSLLSSAPTDIVPPSANRFGPRKGISSVLCIEARWAPTDIKELWASRTKMYERLAPILSCSNNDKTWLMEWQTDQMASSPDLDPASLSKYLGIRFVPVAKQQCFYFSFRLNGSSTLKITKNAPVNFWHGKLPKMSRPIQCATVLALKSTKNAQTNTVRDSFGTVLVWAFLVIFGAKTVAHYIGRGIFGTPSVPY